MNTGVWSAAFTIVVNGLQIDFMELPEQCRIQILRSLFEGKTNGAIDNKELFGHDKAVS